jgi:hypothetical protein
MPIAVATSLLVITMKSFAGFAGFLSTVNIRWGLAAAVTAAAVIGSLAGSRLTGRIREDLLRKAFGWFVVVMGVFVLAQQFPAHLRTNPLLWMVTGTVTVVATAVAIVRHRKRRAGEREPAQPTSRT